MKVWCIVLLIALPASGDGDIITDHLTLTYSADSSRAVGYITTDYVITSVVAVTSFNQRHWGLQWIISGQCELGVCGETESWQQYSTGDFSVVQTYGTFQHPYTTNQAYWLAEFSSSAIIQSSSWFVLEKVEDSDMYEYNASVYVEGIVPEPDLLWLSITLLLKRRVRKTPVRVFLFANNTGPKVYPICGCPKQFQLNVTARRTLIRKLTIWCSRVKGV